MLIVCDFDGTVTQTDTLSYLSERFAPRAFAELEGKLMTGGATLREVLRAELEEMSAGLDTIVDCAVREVPLRPGFAAFCDFVRAHDHRLVLLSAGFRQLIEPMLAAAGVRDIDLIANDVEFTPAGGRVTFRELPMCDLCSQECKRADVASLRQHGETLVYIGDGYSDRCGAESADRIFARAGLARYLDSIDVPYTWFDDFDEIVAALSSD